LKYYVLLILLNYVLFINPLYKEVEILNNQIISLSKSKVYKVKITYYVPELKGINSDSDHKNTAIMRKPKAGRTVAVSSSLLHLLGKKIYIEGVGVRYVEDRMHYSITGQHIDICVSKKDLKVLENRTNVKVVIINI